MLVNIAESTFTQPENIGEHNVDKLMNNVAIDTIKWLLKWALFIFLGLVLVVVILIVLLSEDLTQYRSFKQYGLVCSGKELKGEIKKLYDVAEERAQKNPDWDFRSFQERKIYGFFNKDIIRRNKSITWLSEHHEDGLEPVVLLKEDLYVYRSKRYEYTTREDVRRTLNRETLEYVKSTYKNDKWTSTWVWQCEQASIEVVNQKLKELKSAIKDKQKI